MICGVVVYSIQTIVRVAINHALCAPLGHVITVSVSFNLTLTRTNAARRIVLVATRVARLGGS